MSLSQCGGGTHNDGTACGGQQLIQIVEEGTSLAGGAAANPDCGKMELPVMVQQLIKIAAEDGTHAGGAIANSDCGRRWYSQVLEQCLIWITAEDGNANGGEAANPDCGRRWHSSWWSSS